MQSFITREQKTVHAPDAVQLIVDDAPRNTKMFGRVFDAENCKFRSSFLDCHIYANIIVLLWAQLPTAILVKICDNPWKSIKNQHISAGYRYISAR